MNNKQFKRELKKNTDEALKDYKLHFGEAQPSVCSEYVELGNYVTLIGLKTLALKHEELTDNQIEELIRGEQKMTFLNKYIDVIPNGIYKLKTRGAYSMALNYTNEMYKINSEQGVAR